MHTVRVCVFTCSDPLLCLSLSLRYLRKAEGGEEGKEEVAMFSKEDTKEGSTYKDLVDSFYQGGYSKALREQVLALEKSKPATRPHT